MNAEVVRAADVRTGARLEVFTVLWMIMEAAVSLGAGIVFWLGRETCEAFEEAREEEA